MNQELKGVILKLISQQNSTQHTDFTTVIEEEILTYLGLKTKETSLNLESASSYSNDDFYLEDLPIFTLNNTFTDLYNFLNSIDIKSIIDIGSGYCFMSIVSTLIAKEITVHSIEPIYERMTQAKILNPQGHYYPNLFCDIDLTKINHEAYFLYFPTGKALENILISLLSNKFLYILESHGDLINRADQCSRLIDKTPIIKFKAPRHDQFCYRYQITKNGARSYCDVLSELLYSDELIFFEVCDSSGKWIATNKEASIFYRVSEFEVTFMYPTRSVRCSEANKNVRVINKKDLPRDKHIYIDMMLSKQKLNTYLLRKIYLDKNNIELSNGEIFEY